MVKQFQKKEDINDAVELFIAFLAIFGMSTLPTAHHADSALHGPGKVSSD